MRALGISGASTTTGEWISSRNQGKMGSEGYDPDSRLFSLCVRYRLHAGTRLRNGGDRQGDH